MGSCPRCGAPAHADARFCTECGGYLTATPSFDDLEPPDPSRAVDDPPTRALGDPVQFSGPPVPALGDAEPPTAIWYAEHPQAPTGPSGYAPFGAAHYGAPPSADQSRKGRRRGVLYGGLALLAVLVLATVAVLALDLGGGADSTAEPKDNTPPAATSGDSGSPSPTADTPEGQAEAVDSLLGRAAGGKSMLATAYQKATNCEISPAVAERKFQRAAENRRGVVRSARKLDLSRLDDGRRIKSLMISMYSTSAKADDAFAAWARDGADRSHSCLKENAKRTKGNKLSVKASAQKRRFVKVWNPVAADYGHGKRSRTSL